MKHFKYALIMRWEEVWNKSNLFILSIENSDHKIQKFAKLEFSKVLYFISDYLTSKQITEYI